MTMPERLTKIKNRKYTLPLVFIAAFLLFYAFTGTALHTDSHQYIAMHIRRDPLYPYFLAALRGLFGDGTAYLTAAGVIQSGINALGVWFFADRLTAIMKKGRFFFWMSVIFVCIPYVMTGLLSVTHLNLIGDILTEAFAYPMYLVLFILFLRMSFQPCKRDILISFLVCFLMALLRGQMLSVVVVWLLVILFGIFRTARQNLKTALFRLCLTAVAMAALFTGTRLCQMVYCHRFSGRYETHPNAANLALAHFLYVSDREDARLIPDEPIQELINHDIVIENGDLTLRTLFLLMYDKIEEMQAGYQYESGSFLEKSEHMASFNDFIMFRVIEDTYVASIRLVEYDYANLDLVENDLSALMIKKLLPDNFFGNPGWIDVYLRHVFYGVVRAIGVTAGALTWVFLVIYGVAVAVMVIGFRKKKTVPAIAMLLTLLLIVGVATSTSFIHNCISRYVFYAFPCFYLSLIALFTSLYFPAKASADGEVRTEQGRQES